MNCKNCQQVLIENAGYCNNCGAKIVLQRITFQEMINMNKKKTAFYRSLSYKSYLYNQ